MIRSRVAKRHGKDKRLKAIKTSGHKIFVRWLYHLQPTDLLTALDLRKDPSEGQ